MRWLRRKTDTGRNRGRPSPGRASGAVFSYYQNRVIPDQENVTSVRNREKQAKSAWRVHHIPTVITLAIIVLCLGYSLSLAPNPKIVVVNDQDQATPSLLRPTDAYQKAGQEILQSSIFNKTKVLINTASVEREIQRRFPEVARATVSLPLINRRPVVYVQITQPVFLMKVGPDMYALDEQGRVIMKGDGTIPHSDLVQVEDQTNQSPEVGKPFLPHDQVVFMQTVAQQLKVKQISQFSFILPALANEMQVKFADKPYLLKMTFTGDPRTQSGAFLAVKQKLEADKINPGEYIDVRVDDRAYFK